MTDNYTHPFDRDLLTPKFMANPYPYYQQLRAWHEIIAVLLWTMVVS